MGILYIFEQALTLESAHYIAQGENLALNVQKILLSTNSTIDISAMYKIYTSLPY